MVNYKDTKIYYIQVGESRYYGHTASKYMCIRESQHRCRFRAGERKNKLYESMRAVGMTADDIKCVWVEDYPCDNVNQATARERYWVEQYGALNERVPNRTKHEYRQANREHEVEQKREYYQKNKHVWQEKQSTQEFKDKKNERRRNAFTRCDVCDCEFNTGYATRHNKTDKHIQNVEKSTSNV